MPGHLTHEGSATATRWIAPRWLIATMAGVLASGLGLAAWTIGNDPAAIVGSFAGGVFAGMVVGRYVHLAAAGLASAAPLTALALWGLPRDWTYAFMLPFIVILMAHVQSAIVVAGGVFGVAFGRRTGLGPIRSAGAVAVLALAAGASMTGWLWFAATLGRTR